MDDVLVGFCLLTTKTVNLKSAKEVSKTTTRYEKSNVTVILCVTLDDSKDATANEYCCINTEMMKIWLDNVWKKHNHAFIQSSK